MIATISWIENNYKKFNDLYFGGTLPNISFKVSRSKNTWGYASYKYDFANDTIIPLSITLSNYYDSPEDVKIQTLLHEMIHIEDYFWHPEHFIHNGKKVRKNYYDAHGSWFMNEASRITNESGYKIANHVTHEEINSSKLSENSQKNMENKKNNALICAIIGDNGLIFYFRTDIFKAVSLKKRIPNLKFRMFKNVKSIKFYKFDSDKYLNLRSCNTKLMGWTVDKMNFINEMQKIKATNIYI